MSNHLSPQEALSLLSDLTTLVGEATDQEAGLEQDFKKRTASDRARSKADAHELAVRLQESIDGADRAHQAQVRRVKSQHEKRSLRLDRVFQASKLRVHKEVEGAEGARKNRLQIEIMDEDRRYAAEREALDSAFADHRDHLAELIETQVALSETVRDVLRGYEELLQWPDTAPETEPDHTRDEDQLTEHLTEVLNHADSELDGLRRRFWPRLFRRVPFPHMMISATILHLGAAFALLIAGFIGKYYLVIGGSWCAFLSALPIGYGIGRVTAKPAATVIVVSLERARKICDLLFERSASEHEQELIRLEAVHEQTLADFHSQWDTPLSGEIIERLRAAGQRRVARREAKLRAKIEAHCQSKLERLEHEHKTTVARLQANAKQQRRRLADTYKQRTATARALHETGWNTLETEWQTRTEDIYERIKTTREASNTLFPEWRALQGDHTPPLGFPPAIKFGHMAVDLEKLPGSIPKDGRLALPGPARFSLPLSLTFPYSGSILFDAHGAGRDVAVQSLNNIVLRLLTTMPPGKLAFTIFDAIELGQSFAGLMHLSDYEESLVNSRIWTQTGQMEQRLSDLNEHMEKVIQMYLRNDYDTISEYNENAGDISEKYHFLVIADFPVGFSDIAAKRLASIAASGARCGVYTLIHWDHRRALPPDFVPAELRKNSVCVSCQGKKVALQYKSIEGAHLVLDPPPDPESANAIVHRVGKGSVDAYTVEVPFSHIAPKPDDVWTHDTTDELRIPIGRAGATKLQDLAIGKGTRQHALIAGKTGSGKSTFFHVLVTNLSLWCSPEQVEFYLVDFKKGVEFKCYATSRLPHARVVAIESDRDFGLSVLQRVDQELKRRGDLFRELGVQDVSGYKRAGGKEPIPRTLLIIDEFQEFFVEDDRIAQDASVLLDRIVRQGRAFGIHVLLGSQTLGGAYTLARSTLGQMVIRVALQCNEADSYLIMDDDNPAPRLLSRPGEAIYNDAAGTVEGNSPFQIVWLPDEEREEWLEKISDRAKREPSEFSTPIVFEGNAPADLQENTEIQRLLETKSIRQTDAARIWLGAPNSIKGPTEVTFRRQGGNNVLIVGQRDESILTMMCVSLLSLAAQYRLGTVRLVFLDGTSAGTQEQALVDRVVQAIPHEITLARNTSVADIIKQLADDVAHRQDDDATEAPTTYVLIRNLQTYRKLRYEEDFSFTADAAATPAMQLDNLIAEGPRLGIHVVAACDTYNTVRRVLSRKALTEFDARILFQMSANDSAGLIDAPDASNLGLHRAVYYNDPQGATEVFRPYALPRNGWVEDAAEHLARLHG